LEQITIQSTIFANINRFSSAKISAPGSTPNQRNQTKAIQVYWINAPYAGKIFSRYDHDNGMNSTRGMKACSLQSFIPPCLRQTAKEQPLNIGKVHSVE
jgi:hypothetical protein